MPDPEHHRKLERLYLSAPTNRYYRPTIDIAEERAEIAVDVREAFHHAAQAVHGSVYFKLLDDAAFFAVNSVVPDVFVLTVTFDVQLLRPVSSGTMRATGRLVHASRRLYVGAAEVHDGEGRLLGRGSGTFLPSDIRLDPEVGYV